MKSKFITLFPWSVALLCIAVLMWSKTEDRVKINTLENKLSGMGQSFDYYLRLSTNLKHKYDSVVEVTHKIFFEGSVLPIAITIDDSAIDEVFSDTVGFHLKAKDWDRYYKYTNGSRTNKGRHNIAIGGDINTPLMSGSYNNPIGYQALPKKDSEYVYLPKERHWMKVKKIVVKGLEWHIPIKDTTFPKGNPDTLKKQNT